MTAHRYKTGQSVDFTPSRRDFPSSGRRYEIVRLLPQEGPELLYRIRSKEEPFERIARESELKRRS